MFDLGPSRADLGLVSKRLDRLARFTVQLAKKGKEMAGEIEALRASADKVQENYDQMAMLVDRLRFDLMNTSQQLNAAVSNGVDPAAVAEIATRLEQLASNMQAKLAE